MGGEGAIPPSTGFFYPFVIDVLAPKFGALVVEPEIAVAVAECFRVARQKPEEPSIALSAA